MLAPSAKLKEEKAKDFVSLIGYSIKRYYSSGFADQR